MKSSSLNGLFVAWEYNRMSSSILKLYKYKSVKDISTVLSELFIDTIMKSAFQNNLKNTLLIPVPISNMRKNERGFNQMEYITVEISKRLQLKYSTDMVLCRSSVGHQARKNRLERYKIYGESVLHPQACEFGP